jgi:ABC-2 type transport system ATP-binding protein
MSAMREPLVSFQDLSVSYGPLQALVAVSGVFNAGPTGLLGPNGAGKTTLLKTLLGFLTPDSGRLTAFGLDPSRTPLEVRRKVGYMPEVDCHIGGMTASAFVAFAGELSGIPRDEAISRSHEVLYYVGLGEARYRTVDTYSTGMKQRVKLAQALVGDPRLLLLDEPTIGLDPAGRAAMLELIGRIGADFGISIVVASHLLGELEQICDHIVAVDGGKLLRADTITSFTRASQVLVIEVEEGTGSLLAELARRGLDARQQDRAVLVRLAGEDTYDAIRDAVADLRLPLNRMEQRRHRIEELFRGDQAASSEMKGAADAR